MVEHVAKPTIKARIAQKLGRRPWAKKPEPRDLYDNESVMFGPLEEILL